MLMLMTTISWFIFHWIHRSFIGLWCLAVCLPHVLHRLVPLVTLCSHLRWLEFRGQGSRALRAKCSLHIVQNTHCTLSLGSRALCAKYTLHIVQNTHCTNILTIHLAHFCRGLVSNVQNILCALYKFYIIHFWASFAHGFILQKQILIQFIVLH